MKMSYDRIGNHQVRDKGRKLNIFTKVNEIKRDLKNIVPELPDDQLLKVLNRCSRHYLGKLHYGRYKKSKMHGNTPLKRELTMNERAVYDYLIRKKLNPGTTYRWFLATRLPQDLKKELAQGKISQKLAMKIAANRRRTKYSTIGLIMMEEIRNVVQKLDWRG